MEIKVEKQGERYQATAEDGRKLEVEGYSSIESRPVRQKARIRYDNRGAIIELDIGENIIFSYTQPLERDALGRPADRRQVTRQDLEGLDELAQAICNNPEVRAVPSVVMYIDEQGLSQLRTRLFETKSPFPFMIV
jgi:hypothetical protein